MTREHRYTWFTLMGYIYGKVVLYYLQNVFSNLTREQNTNTPKNIDDVQQCHNSTTTTSKIHDYVETRLTLLYTKR